MSLFSSGSISFVCVDTQTTNMLFSSVEPKRAGAAFEVGISQGQNEAARNGTARNEHGAQRSWHSKRGSRVLT
jgi:hypothetical protein